MEKLWWQLSEFPFGRIAVGCSERGVREVRFCSAPMAKRLQRQGREMQGASGKEAEIARRAASQISSYFTGRLQHFTIPLDLRGTAFQRKVWKELLKIPYGHTRSYQEIARQLGNPRAARAVGMANHRNPAAILVPCHRVIASDGKLGGYAGGIHLKTRLLQLEQVVAVRKASRGTKQQKQQASKKTVLGRL